MITTMMIATTRKNTFQKLFGYSPAIRPVTPLTSDVEDLRAVGVGQQPQRHEDVLERPRGKRRVDHEVAIGVAGHLRRAHLFELLRASTSSDAFAASSSTTW